MTETRKRVLLRIAIPLAVALIFNLVSIRGWLVLAFDALVTIGLTVAAGWLLDRHDKKLTSRIEATGPIHWEAWLNGVVVGTVSDSHYAALQRLAFRDWTVMVAQLCNCARVLIVALEKVIVGVPLMAFWLLVCLAVFSPETYPALMKELLNASPASISEAVKNVAIIGVLFAFTTSGFMVMFGYRFGFRNCYSEAVGRRLQRHFMTPALGEITLCRPISAVGSLS